MRTTIQDSFPQFLADQYSVMRNTGRQVDWSYVADSYRNTFFQVVANGASAIGASAVAVDPLANPLPIGAQLSFSGGESVVVAEPAPAGSTSIAVRDALTVGVADAETADVAGTGQKVIPAGTAMAELASGKVVPRAAAPGAETAMGLLFGSAAEGDSGMQGYGILVGCVAYENLLPDYADAAWATYKGELEAAGHFAWQTYQDTTS